MNITAEMLMPYVECGATSRRMSDDLGVSIRGVQAALHRRGLYERWRAKRNKLSPEAVMPYVQRGAHASEMIADFNVAHTTLRRALREYGLHTLWAQHRFKKCASRLDGSSSVSTASEAHVSSTPSARLAAQTVTGTSYGS